MVVVVAQENAAQALDLLRASGEVVAEIGRIEPRAAGEAATVVI